MEASNTLDRMATYDFKTPIDIVYFEENSDDEIDLTSSPKSKDVDTNIVENEIDSNSTKNETIEKFGKNLEQIEGEKEINSKKRKSVIEITESEKDNENIKEHSTTVVASKKTKPNNLNTLDKASDSLKTVSKCLTLILESLQHYLLAANNKTSTPYQLSLSKKSYLTVKYHFFKAAYEHVNNHILPNENNEAFIHNFLNYTIMLANNRIKIDCNQGITELYFEMIKWVKQRKLKDFSDSCKTPILIQHLSDPPVIPDVTISESIHSLPQNSPNDANQNKLCIFSSGTQGREIMINVDKSLLINNNQVPGSNLLTQNNVIQQNINTQQNLHNRTSPNSHFPAVNVNNLQNNYGNHQIYGESMRRQPLVPSNGYVPITDNRVPHYAPPSNRLDHPPDRFARNFVNESHQISHLNNPNTNYNYYQTTNNIQNNNFYSANNFIYNGTSYVPNTIVRKDGSCRTLRNERRRVPPPPYRSPVQVQVNQMMQPVTPAPTVLSGLPSGPDLTRSSVSTDSGFVSPVGSKSSTNTVEDIMNDLFELENTFEPPRATPAQPVCHVCHKHAKLMCSACFKTVYCNAECQRMDWGAHRLFCPPPTGKRSQ